ncbi:LysR family transcriptional regulator [Bordetella genomosp. 13]|uniref:LysR family transcriptional regulator n=1 Tax=Bordetella genomosp. 13 TaxID=463040 RepID=UPI0011A67CF2|nr:LysR family transcriptional regulator [Bordetella genomosp. 13]
MDIPLLRMLVAAIEERSLSRAAQRERIVVSAASRRIAELERLAGTALLRRSGRGVTPTPAGEMLYQRAKAILRSMEQAREALSAYSDSGQPRIRLAVNPSTMVQFLPADLSGFLRRHPDFRLDLVEAFSGDVPRLVAGGDADIGLYHAHMPAPGVTSIPYRIDRVGLVVPTDHVLAGRDAMSLEETLDYPFLGFFPRHTVEAFMEMAGNSISRPPMVRCQISNYEARCRMVAEGLGLAIVPEMIARSHARTMPLALVSLTDAWASRQILLCVRDRQVLPSGAGRLIEHLCGVRPGPAGAWDDASA